VNFQATRGRCEPGKDTLPKAAPESPSEPEVRDGRFSAVTGIERAGFSQLGWYRVSKTLVPFRDEGFFKS
jgi:hypothetical protein